MIYWSGNIHLQQCSDTLVNTQCTLRNTHIWTHKEEKKKKAAATTPGVPPLDAVFVPRALREVCLLAEPLWSLQQTCLACCCAVLCCSLLEEISVNGRGMHWFDEWVHICGSTGGQCAVWCEELFLWLELDNKAFSSKRTLQESQLSEMLAQMLFFLTLSLSRG